jgi:hypothetical protein
MTSNTTFHSFNDDQLFEEPEDVSTPSSASVTSDPMSAAKEILSSSEMRRQDSGYESIGPHKSQPGRRRTSTISSSASRTRQRPSTRRSSRAGPVAPLPRSTANLLYSSQPHHQYGAYYHFPSPEHDTPYYPAQDAAPAYDNPFAAPARSCPEPAPHPLPPQTTHYWTSDRTRRLEYAAIDAAGRGVKGWVMRHMVPECFVPREQRRLGFDDDTGSVRRYRLELDGEEGGLQVERRRKGWPWNGGATEE